MDREIVKETQEERRRRLSSAVAWMAPNLAGESPEEKEEKEAAELDCLLKNMPIDIRPEILSRLPIKSIGRFMTASKGWRDLITSRRFSSMYAKNKPGYTFFGTSSSGDFDNSCVVEVSESGDSIRTDFGEVDDPDRICADLVGSCNGLLCLVERGFGVDKVVIANPVTDERRRINYSNYSRDKWEVHYRFGYSPSTNEYKILRCCTAVTDVMEVDDMYDILTVGVDKEWRTLSPRLFPTYLMHVNTPMVPCCKGTFHWIAEDGDDDDSFILAFDIAEENTRRIPIPQTDQRCWKLLVCNDPLCLYYNNDQADVMWKMEDDDGDRWSQFEVPCIPRVIDFIASLDCATKSGGILFKVKGCDVMRLYCPKSNKYTTFLIPLEWSNDKLLGIETIPLRDVTCLPDETRLLCEITPTFSSINEMISKPSK